MEITKELLEALSEKYGEAFYLLDSSKFVRNYHDLLTAFRDIYPNTFIAYSYKTNYTPKLCKLVDNLGGYAEIVSEMEYCLASRIGVEPRHIIFNGPYKSEKAVEQLLLAGGLVNIDSYYELDLIQRVARNNTDTPISVGIRCNFDIQAGISRFGFDVEEDTLHNIFAMLRQYDNITIKGLHCHFPTRTLESFINRTDKMLNLVKEYFASPPDFISLGGGFFGKMSPVLERQFNYKIPSYREYAGVIASRVSDFYRYMEDGRKPKLIIEPGSALVADTMQFVARVINIKAIREKKIATLSGSIHNINPTLNSKNLPITIYGSTNQSGRHNLEDVDFGGYTCIESDYLYKGYSGSLAIGDHVVFDNVGSYSVVLKPPFILPNFPVIDYNVTTNTAEVVKRKEEMDDIFRTYSF